MKENMKKLIGFPLLALVIGVLSPAEVNAASNKDKALALAASGCAAGWLDSPFLLNLNNTSQLVISTALSSQWSEDLNNSFVQIHHTQMLEGWSLAANLDTKWSKLSNTYSAIFEFVGKETLRGKLFGTILSSAELKFAGIINANCKIAVNSARTQAKKSGKTFPRWVISAAGNLLPPLDPRFKS